MDPISRKVAEIRQQLLADTDSRAVHWHELPVTDRRYLCHSAHIDPGTAERAWDQLPAIYQHRLWAAMSRLSAWAMRFQLAAKPAAVIQKAEQEQAA